MAQLRPLWEHLTNIAPAYRLAELGPDDGLPSEAEREHRMRIELEDIIFAVSRWLPAGTVWPEGARDRAAVLHEACEEFSQTCGQPAVRGSALSSPLWAVHDDEVDDVARAWATLQPRGQQLI
ncbi:hypothetical protein GORHZ_006_00050 [Gordonia rhizosphera NBRC 16068]|uniref:DUF6545 domain-containing protein n=2 Tax=Gordonia rhizosphera TaxID=83341 RepID=K6W338_9ACTN|nr:hypothetical protein GORHZ_006_00050 [Gordonia rhizosphera NBRC 16068]